jgi:predicted permease
MESLLQDLGHSIRALRKAPAFTASAVVTLALGLGVNIAVFSLMHAALLERLPVRHGDRLVQIYQTTSAGSEHFEFSYPLYVDFRDSTTSFDGLAAHMSLSVGVNSDDASERVVAEFVTANYFSVLGVGLSAGPGLAGRDELRGASPTAVVSTRLWNALYAGQSSIIGATLHVNGKPFSIVGVAPAPFDGIVRGQVADVWIPVSQFAAVRNRPDAIMTTRESSWLSLFGRLASGATAEQAGDEITRIGRGLNVINAGPDFTARARSAARGDVGNVEGLARPLRLLMLVVALILVVAVANVANLMLTRTHARQAEIAMRQALGAGRGRIVRHLLTEAAVVTFAGGALGLLLASWIIELFEIRTATGGLLTLRVEPDITVVAFAIALSVLAALGSGLIPALSSARPDLLAVIKGSGDGTGDRHARRRIRSGLVVVQVALSLLLVVGGGLFLRSLARLQSIDPTLSTNRVIAANLNLNLRGYDAVRGGQFYADVLERVSALSGVQAASLAYVLPVTAGGARMDVRGSSVRPAVEGMVSIELISISPGFFRTVGVPLVSGRDFGAADSPAASKVVVINETMRQKFWPSSSAIGQSFAIGGNTYEVIGVARDTKYRSLREAPRMVMYLPYAQDYQSTANLLVRTSMPVEPTVADLRAVLREIDPGMPLFNVRTLAEHVNRSLYADRLRAELIGWLAALALVLAAVGIYGIVSFSVAERTREVGIRLALGADPRLVLRMVLGGSLRLATVGLGAGLLLTAWLTRRIASDLYGVGALDPATIVGSCAVLLAVVMAATLIPARRATRIDPVVALRTE